MGSKMRRGFSIFLVLVFVLGPLASTLDASDDAGLPACCRRHGAHRCAMTVRRSGLDEARSSSAPLVSAPLTCPYYPGPALFTFGPGAALAAVAAHLPALRTSHYAPAATPRFATSRPGTTHAGRGPPTSL
jgi:hypothetical protein